MNQRIDITKYVLSNLGLLTDDKTLKKALNLWWRNPRTKTKGGFRLSEQGYQALKKAEIKDYEIAIPLEEIDWNNKLIIWLDRYVDCPFYITKTHIYVFGERMAVQLILFSGNIQKFGLARAKNVANSQQL
jgi:hypothetical protein